MVLYKRKPIILPDPLPLPADLNVYVWHIDETGEWFYSYEEYLRRLDFYMRHHFTCEITGTSCLTFFQALDSEEAQFKYVEEKFPLKLREPVARFLHFNVIKRLDSLVEQVYGKFKNDYFPGEVVYLRRPKDLNPAVGAGAATVSTISSSSSSSHNPTTSGLDATGQPQYQSPYIVKEKAQFNATVDPRTGSVLVPGHCKYMLIEDDNHLYENGQRSQPTREPTGKSIIVDQSQIYRDRSSFTKHLIKCFFKITLHKASSKTGAPWSVKPEYLSMYGLTMNWPPELVQYKDDEPAIEEISVLEAPVDETNGDSKKTKGKNKRKKDSESNENDIEDETNGKSNKKKKPSNNDIPDVENVAVKTEPSIEPPVVLNTIIDDLEIPFKQDEEPFMANLQYYNNNLESVHLSDITTNPLHNLPHFERVLQIYQFLISFSDTLLLSRFNFDQFITSIKCTNGYELIGEVVEVSVQKEMDSKIESIENGDGENGSESDQSEDGNNSDMESDPISDWNRNSKIRKMIEAKTLNSNEPLKYDILKNDPASDDVIDDVNNNGSAILVESFVSLLSLFINEKGEWITIVSEDWYDLPHEFPEIIVDEEEKATIHGVQNNMKTENEDDTKDSPKEGEQKINKDEHEQESSDDEMSEEEERVEKCLNFRNVHWSERLTKRQFSNHFWLIILLGIFQDSSAVPKYTKFIKLVTEKLIPAHISASHLPKQLWRNFCRELSFSEKIEALWVLVDMVTHYSQDIKQAVDDSLELSNQIRSEKFKIAREIKSLISELCKINSDTDVQQYRDLQAKIDSLQNDKTFLEKQILETELQRLKPLGVDRYGNRFFWFGLSGVPVNTYTEEELNENNTELNYSTGRLFIQGPSRQMVKYLLKISDEEISNWKWISEKAGKTSATKEVFQVYRREDGSMWHISPENNGVEVELLSNKGKLNSSFELSNIQKMILDETPEYLLLDDEMWYSVNNVDDLASILNRLNIWGRREHDLLRQFRNTTLDIENTMLVRNKILNPPEFSNEENDLLEELNKNALTTTELLVGKEGQNKTTFENKEKTKEEVDEDRLDIVEVRLDEIADEIMNLEDSSKTRTILTQIKSLEDERDELLEEKEQKKNLQRPGGRILARSEKRRNTISRDNKLSKQSELLTDLINYRHFKAMEDVIRWKNNIAIKRFGSELRKSTSSKKNYSMKELVPTISEKMENILKELDSMK
ncbi:similar to Saccharomyces cerevisiae YGL133W ITC1 Subunit of the ATP- dependent Isw2p-Itc1p chromatin remodeling complex [Maudiozyma barnettii]|uniref:Similar to Saccharomyces cerevisiae YGL133W ITC1 Subunit of the ATP- dependent Isw2p-Itc1p chromatin remodeling complex n=1 Tax=Maudiozyma barnettii TaxID=61262 RepID=A0A8H2VEU7_9SACH|nr:Itc1p [Kazachstania barnettii]CAB4254299.1 similar to Saccharomyces cerevisiae YGL133W ITC1 Subunit of the ATP- dependent Isw2p-Itc1p chromatin remodeling complex [Kazachstania barnettii]CAD1782109.1 similar to Saccharomyces cerevisiae YGL133W ITC1 Subunit of the ATP- dependent Isw2p-Itc1p chromatin remodeling complex [Kazachstania barnettii]